MGGMEVQLHTLSNMEPDGDGEVHWSGHLISPQGRKSPEYVGGGWLELVWMLWRTGNSAHARKETSVPWLFSPWPIHYIDWAITWILYLTTAYECWPKLLLYTLRIILYQNPVMYFVVETVRGQNTAWCIHAHFLQVGQWYAWNIKLCFLPQT